MRYEIVSQFRLADAQKLAAVGFANAGPDVHNAIAIDNVFAEVGIDADGRVGRFDNCPDSPNPDQADTDQDGQGDACDEFPQGGSALDQCLDDLDTLLSDPSLMDLDGDGEADASDRCPGTTAATEVDEAGCSAPQFCAAIDSGSWRGRWACALADWRNDCRVIRGVCVPR